MFLISICLVCLASKYCRDISAIVFENGDPMVTPFMVGKSYLEM